MDRFYDWLDRRSEALGCLIISALILGLFVLAAVVGAALYDFFGG